MITIKKVIDAILAIAAMAKLIPRPKQKPAKKIKPGRGPFDA